MKDVTDELELEEADDEADRKQEGPSEMDLKVLYTYRILHVEACLIGFVACIFLKGAGPRGLCSSCSGC